MKLHVRYCAIAERDHERSLRQYAHTLHRDGVICVCRAFWDLPVNYFFGVLAHEIGHIFAERAGLTSTEDEADEVVWLMYEIHIKYKDGPFGKQLEWISNADIRKLGDEFKIPHPRTIGTWRGEKQLLIEGSRP